MTPRTQAVEYLVMHHWGGWSPANREEAAASCRAEGYADIPYHYLIMAEGVVWPGRGEQWESAANLGINHKALAFCLLGNFDADDNPSGARGLPIAPTDAQLLAAGQLVKELLSRHPDAKLIQHRDVARLQLESGQPAGLLTVRGKLVSVATACPGSRAVATRAAWVIFLLASGLALEAARARALVEPPHP